MWVNGPSSVRKSQGDYPLGWKLHLIGTTLPLGLLISLTTAEFMSGFHVQG